MIWIVYFTRADIFGIHEKIWLSCGRDRKPPDQKGKKKCLLGAPLPAAQTFSSMKSLLRWTKQVDLERKMKKKGWKVFIRFRLVKVQYTTKIRTLPICIQKADS